MVNRNVFSMYVYVCIYIYIYIYIYIQYYGKTSIEENRKGKAKTKILVHNSKLQGEISICL